MRKGIAILAVLLCPPAFTWCQELQRRSFIGLELVGQGPRLMVRHVETGSTAENAGVVIGDTLLAIGGIAISDANQLTLASHTYRAGTSIRFSIERNGQPLQKTSIGRPLPYETSPFADVLYRSVVVDGALHRVIVTKPKPEGRYPAVLLIGGLGCYSLDGLSEQGGAYGRIRYGLTRAGYVTLRVEKSGEGDSEGPPCTSPQADLHLAVKRSIGGLGALKTYDFVDSNRIFILAHSIGPLEGALVAAQFPVNGFIAAETIGRSWFDYQTEIARSQPLLLGKPFNQIESSARLNELCMFKFYVGKQMPDAIRKSNPECTRYIPKQGDVPYTYYQQIADIDLSALWKKIDTPVLVIYGTSDPTTSSEESRYLVDMIDSFHPGRATYVEIPGMSHHFDRQPNQADALRALPSGRDGEFEPKVITEIQDWMKHIT